MAETSELSGLELRAATARMLGWDTILLRAYFGEPTLYGTRGEDEGEIPAYESDPATLPEM